MIILSDLHGSFKTMLALLAKCPKDDIVICGDLCDRGSRSMQVVDYVIKNNIPCVKGNHEDMMVNAATDFTADQIWQMNGGDKTLDSYRDENGNIDTVKLEAHRKWMENLPLYLEFKDVKNDKGEHLVISHSSIGKVWDWNENKRLAQKNHFENVVIWGRSPPVQAKGIYNVFGHTPHTIHDMRIKSFYANIDTGACFNSKEHRDLGYGVLTALQFPSMKIFQQENID